jgi:ribonuclease E
LAGLIVVDFIDMESYGNTRKIEQAMRRALKRDRARIQTGNISEFGLMEISRQRLRPSFAENHTVKCPHCGGSGRMVSSHSAGLMLLRRLEEDDTTGSDRITASATTSTVMWILNHKRDLIRNLEEKYKYQLLFKADDTLLAPDARLELTRMKADGSEASQTLNVEWREQAEVPPEKRYTKEGRAQRQREEEAREDLRSEKPEQRAEQRAERSDARAEPRTEQPRAERSERAPRPEREPRAERVKPAEQAAPKASTKAEPKAAEKPAAPKAKKPAVVAEDKPLAVQKVVAEQESTPAVQPKAKPKMALKMQPDTDRDVSPIAVAKVEADRTAVAAPKAASGKKVALKTKDGETKAEKGILNRLLGI